MDSKQTGQPMLQVGQSQLFAMVREFMGGGTRGLEDPDNPLPPGPWDPVIRDAVERVRVFGPLPDPWRPSGRGVEILRLLLATIAKQHPEIWDVIGGGGRSILDEVALNPQPLPPRYAFLTKVAQVVASRAELLQEIAGAMSQPGSEQAIIIIGGYTSRFADDWCGTGWRLRWPFPGPRPNWFHEELDGTDLLVMAAALDQGAKESFRPEMGRALSAASAKFAETGVARTAVVAPKGMAAKP